jgi:cytochrome d ubiquinol oxidase subunit II
VTAALLVSGVIVTALVVYALTGGADFGGGVWDLAATGSRARAQRELVARAVAPIWEANHVWLILVIVLLFVCFPRVYATIGTALHVPLTIMLIGIVLRGSAFAFRSHDYGPAQARWDLVFAGSSVVTPVMLGACVGAVASGRIRVGEDGVVQTTFAEWLAPFPLMVGVFTLALFSFLAATYLTLETDDPHLQDDFRARALGSSVVTWGLGAAVVALARDGAPVVAEGLLGRPWLFVGVGLLAVGAFAALVTRRWQLARALAAAQVAAIILGWAAAQFPWLVVPDLSVESAAAEVVVLRTTLWILAAGSVVLVPSFVLLYGVFKRAQAGY